MWAVWGAHFLVRHIETECDAHVAKVRQHVVVRVRGRVSHLMDVVVYIVIYRHRDLGAPVCELQDVLHVGQDFEQVFARPDNPGRKADRDTLGRVHTKPNNVQGEAAACWRCAFSAECVVHRTIAW